MKMRKANFKIKVLDSATDCISMETVTGWVAGKWGRTGDEFASGDGDLYIVDDSDWMGFCPRQKGSDL